MNSWPGATRPEDMSKERVAVSGGCSEALDCLERLELDLLLLDLKMPGMSGIELVERAREKAGRVPIVIVSGYVAPADREHLRKLNVAVALSKPVDLETLKETLVRAISGSRPDS